MDFGSFIEYIVGENTGKLLALLSAVCIRDHSVQVERTAYRASLFLMRVDISYDLKKLK